MRSAREVSASASASYRLMMHRVLSAGLMRRRGTSLHMHTSKSSVSVSSECIRVVNTTTSSQSRSPDDIHLIPIHRPGQPPLTWYACGPTVYDVAHLGHARTYVTTDILRRILTDYFHIPVYFALGITDVDDKIIKRLQEQSPKTLQSIVDPVARRQEYAKFTRQLEQSFFDDMQALNVKRPDCVLRVTEHIEEIIQFIEKLCAGGVGYVSRKDGSVYFSVDAALAGASDRPYDRFRCMGASNEQLLSAEDELPVGVKKNPRDFALWKVSKKLSSHPCDVGITAGRA